MDTAAESLVNVIAQPPDDRTWCRCLQGTPNVDAGRTGRL